MWIVQSQRSYLACDQSWVQLVASKGEQQPNDTKEMCFILSKEWRLAT